MFLKVKATTCFDISPKLLTTHQYKLTVKHLEVKFKKGLQQRQQVKFDEFKSAFTVILKSTIMLVVNTK